jgi:gas vesicle protein
MNYHKQENQYEPSNPSGFLAGLLLGSLAGAGTMLFLAPHSGQKTRAQIRRISHDWREQTAETVTDSVAQVRAEVDQVTTNLQKQAEELQQRGQDMVDQQKERWLPVVEAGKTAVKG